MVMMTDNRALAISALNCGRAERGKREQRRLAAKHGERAKKNLIWSGENRQPDSLSSHGSVGCGVRLVGSHVGTRLDRQA
jgi:hypothetical protein